MTKHNIRAFLIAIDHYRCFIPKFSTALLTLATRSSLDKRDGSGLQRKIIRVLGEQTAHMIPLTDDELFLHTGHGIGAVLCIKSTGKELPFG